MCSRAKLSCDTNRKAAPKNRQRSILLELQPVLSTSLHALSVLPRTIVARLIVSHTLLKLMLAVQLTIIGGKADTSGHYHQHHH